MQNFEGFEQATEWIEQKTKDSFSKIVDHEGRPYLLSSKELTPILKPKYPCVEATTLTGLIDFVEFSDFDNTPEVYIHVVSPTQVKLVYGQHGPFLQSDCLMDVKALTPRIALNTFIDQESFIIQAQ